MTERAAVEQLQVFLDRLIYARLLSVGLQGKLRDGGVKLITSECRQGTCLFIVLIAFISSLSYCGICHLTECLGKAGGIKRYALDWLELFLMDQTQVVALRHRLLLVWT